MNCDEIRDRFSEYLDSELTENEIRLVDHHLSKCELCKKELWKLRKMMNDIETIKRIKAPDDSWEKFEKHIDEYTKEACKEKNEN